MRARRSAKFAEYLSTYAILQHIGIHPTALIEKRDAAVGVGVYVRDACDAGTTLFAVPSRRFAANSVLSKIGLKCAFHDPWERDQHAHNSSTALLSSLSWSSSSRPLHAREEPIYAVQDGIVAFLTGSAAWPELAWRLALERHRSVSHLWGWLQSLPSAEEFHERQEATERHCRVHHTMLLPYYQKGRQRLEEDVSAAYRQLRHDNLLPSFATFAWAVNVLLSRGLLLPLAWPEHRAGALSLTGEEGMGDEDEERGVTLELGVAPFVDLVNAPDAAGRTANAQIEVASSLDELPTFFKEETVAAWAKRGRDGLQELEKVLETHYYFCLTLQVPLRASEEVIVPYEIPVLTTGVLTEEEDLLVTRFLKYGF